MKSHLAPVLVIVGGSRGIGAAVARRAVSDGYRVVIGYHTAGEAAAALVAELSACGGVLQALPLDVADASSVDAFFNAAADAFGVPAAMVYAAGIAGLVAPLIEVSGDAIAQVLETNLLGAFHAVQAASRRMVLSRGGTGGSIVVISSEAGKFGGTRISPYAASKAGLNALVIGVARELAADGVRLNGVSPGVIDTDQQAGISEERRQSLLASIPLGRMGEAREVANAVMWLLSCEASYVTGSVLTVAGGR